MIPLRTIILIGLCCCALPARAKTVVITDADCEKIAVISAEAPRMSWVGYPLGLAEYSNHLFYMNAKSAFLMCYPLEKIPPGHRITKAEWVVPYGLAYPVTGAKVQVRRVLQEWGAGVSHQYRMTRPQRLEWHTPGAHGLGQDRATKSTALGTFKGSGECTFNVTEDVELWYSGAVPNYGWLLTVEDPDSIIQLQSPFWGAPKGFKLRITYEPQ